MKIKSAIAKISSRVFAAIIEINESKTKDGSVIDYGKKNTFPNELMQIVYNSPTATRCIETLSSFIQADGFIDKTFAGIKNVLGESNDYTLSRAADSYSFFNGCYYRVLYNLEGMPASIEVLPFECVRKLKNGGYVFNPNLGTKDCKKIDDIFYPEFNPRIDKSTRLSIIERGGGLKEQKGEVFLSFRKKPGKLIYPIPDYWAGIDDIKSDAALLLVENSNIEQGFNVDFVLYTVGEIDDTQKGSDGLTDFERFRNDLKTFRTPGEKKILHIQSETKEGMPVFAPVPLNQVMDSIEKARERVPRAVCRHIGVPPVLIGLPNPEGFGNSQALVNYIKLFSMGVLAIQSQISDDFKRVFPFHDTSISTLTGIDYLPDYGIDVLSTNEKRALLGYKPLTLTNDN